LRAGLRIGRYPRRIVIGGTGDEARAEQIPCRFSVQLWARFGGLIHGGYISGPVEAGEQVFEQAYFLNIVLQPSISHRLRENEFVNERIEKIPQYRQIGSDGERRNILCVAAGGDEVVVQASQW